MCKINLKPYYLVIVVAVALSLSLSSSCFSPPINVGPTLLSRVQAAEQQAASVKADNAALRTTLQAFGDRLFAVESAKQAAVIVGAPDQSVTRDLQSRMDTIENSQRSLFSSAQTLSSSVTALQKSTAASPDVTALKDQVASLKSEIVSLKADADRRLQVLETAAPKETDIAKLRSEIAALYNTLSNRITEVDNKLIRLGLR